MKRLFIAIATVCVFPLYFVSCYYDSEEVLYPVFKCDSTNITYDNTISVMMHGYCTGCHSESNPQGNISLTTYEEVVAHDSLITAAITLPGPKHMPKDGNLDDCSLKQWDIWIKTKMPRN